MSDHYVLLLERVVKENEALREQMTQMADNEKAVLGDLHKKIDSLQSLSTSSRRPRQTGPSLRIPLQGIYLYRLFAVTQAYMRRSVIYL